MNRKAILIFIVFYYFTASLYGQIDSLSERLLYNWTISPIDLSPQYSDIDTTLNEIQLFNPLLKIQ